MEMRSYPTFYPALCAFRNIPAMAEKLHHRRVEQSITVSPFRGGFYLVGLLRTGASGTGGSPDDDSIIIMHRGKEVPCHVSMTWRFQEFIDVYTGT